MNVPDDIKAIILDLLPDCRGIGLAAADWCRVYMRTADYLYWSGGRGAALALPKMCPGVYGGGLFQLAAAGNVQCVNGYISAAAEVYGGKDISYMIDSYSVVRNAREFLCDKVLFHALKNGHTKFIDWHIVAVPSGALRMVGDSTYSRHKSIARFCDVDTVARYVPPVAVLNFLTTLCEEERLEIIRWCRRELTDPVHISIFRECITCAVEGGSMAAATIAAEEPREQDIISAIFSPNPAAIDLFPREFVRAELVQMTSQLLAGGRFLQLVRVGIFKDVAAACSDPRARVTNGCMKYFSDEELRAVAACPVCARDRRIGYELVREGLVRNDVQLVSGLLPTYAHMGIIVSLLTVNESTFKFLEQTLPPYMFRTMVAHVFSRICINYCAHNCIKQEFNCNSVYDPAMAEFALAAGIKDRLLRQRVLGDLAAFADTATLLKWSNSGDDDSILLECGRIDALLLRQK